MERSRNQFFAGSAFPGHQHGRVARANALHQFQQAADRWAVADNACIRGNLLLQHGVFGFQAFDLTVRFESDGGQRCDGSERLQMSRDPADFTFL